MSVSLFVSALAVGAALNAFWVHSRFPGIAPRELRMIVVHVISALLVAHIATAGGIVEVALAAGALAPVATVAVALPILVYQFLVGFWVVQLTQDVFRRHRL